MKKTFLLFAAAMICMFQAGPAVLAGESLKIPGENYSEEAELDLDSLNGERQGPPRAPAEFGLTADDSLEFEVNPEQLEY